MTDSPRPSWRARPRLIGLVVALLGLVASLALTLWLRHDAEQRWERQAYAAAARVGESAVGLLNQSATTLHNLAPLFARSPGSGYALFDDAIASLESRTRDFVPISVAAVDPTASRVMRSTDLTGPLVEQATIERDSTLGALLARALKTPGEVQLASPDGTTLRPLVAYSALAVDSSSAATVLVQSVDIGELMRGLNAFPRAQPGLDVGMQLRSAINADNDFVTVVEVPAGSHYSLSGRDEQVALGAELRLRWGVNETFLGGPDLTLSSTAFGFSTFATVLVALFTASVLGRYQLVEQRVREATAESRAAGARLTDAINSLDAGFVMFDAERRVEVHNARFTTFYPELLGRDLAGTTFVDILNLIRPPDAGDDWVEMREREFANGQRGVLLEHAGRVLMVNRSARGDGGTVSVTADITELVQSQRVASVLRDAIDQLGDAVELRDERGAVLFRNAAFSALDPRVSSPAARAAIEPGEEPEVDAPDGSTYLCREQQIESGASLLLLTDVTARKRTLLELEQARDAAEAGANAKSVFLATMSHEIRTPLNGVVGMVDLLAGTKLDREQRDMLDTVRQSSVALLTIINEVLDYSKIEAGRMELELVPCSLEEVAESTVQALSPIAREKALPLTAFVDPALPSQVIGDSVRLRQILLNLAGNAVKFTAEGRVLVRVDQLGRGGEQVRVRFTVADTGIGMSEEAQAQLFQPFSQAEASTTRRFGGTGLGLSIAQRLTELMGGRIAVESTPDVGSTFTFEVVLPCVVEQRAAPRALDDTAVAVIDADAEFVDFARAYVESAGGRVVELPAAEVVVVGSASEDVTRLAECEALRGIVLPPELTLPDEVAARAHSEVFEPRPLRRQPLVHAIVRAARSLDAAGTETEFDAAPVGAAPPAGRLLVAEDNLVNQKVLGRQLEMLGYPFDIVDDGVQAMEALDRGGYALLLTDCHMPNMDGFELTRSVRAGEGGGERMPVIAVTASAMREEVERCREAGMDDVVTKPVDMRHLDETLRAYLG